MTVYLIHITPAYKHAKHYIGFTTDDTPGRANRRIQQHVKGLAASSPLLRAALAAGSKLKVAYMWIGADRTFERKLKNRKDANRWCPCCGKKGHVPKNLTEGENYGKNGTHTYNAHAGTEAEA